MHGTLIELYNLSCTNINENYINVNDDQTFKFKTTLHKKTSEYNAYVNCKQWNYL